GKALQRISHQQRPATAFRTVGTYGTYGRRIVPQETTSRSRARKSAKGKEKAPVDIISTDEDAQTVTVDTTLYEDQPTVRLPTQSPTGSHDTILQHSAQRDHSTSSFHSTASNSAATIRPSIETEDQRNVRFGVTQPDPSGEPALIPEDDP
ncbi:uncharacterized protein LY89DRAFT_721762, partial [Mollisia scopiformis]